jgi:hypothetical protein
MTAQLPVFALCAREWWEASGARTEERLREIFEHQAKSTGWNAPDLREPREHVWRDLVASVPAWKWESDR